MTICATVPKVLKPTRGTEADNEDTEKEEGTSAVGGGAPEAI